MTLDLPVCIVGRHGNSHLSLPAPQVSKLHALLVREKHRVYVRDLASTNGVEVNGDAVRERALRDADVLRIGAYTLQCEAGFTDEVKDQEDDPDAELPPAELRSKDKSFPIPPGRHTLLIGRRPGCEKCPIPTTEEPKASIACSISSKLRPPASSRACARH